MLLVEHSTEWHYDRRTFGRQYQLWQDFLVEIRGKTVNVMMANDVYLFIYLLCFLKDGLRVAEKRKMGVRSC